MQTPYMASSVVLATNADGVEFTSMDILANKVPYTLLWVMSKIITT